MKIIETRSADGNSVTYTKQFEIGEKYRSILVWDRKDGKITKEKVEAMVPGCTYIKTNHVSVLSADPKNFFQKITVVKVIIERTRLCA